MPPISLSVPLAGWLCPLHEVPDPVFASGMLGQGVAIDPLGDVLHAPAAGEVIGFHEAGHAVTLRLHEGVELLLHFGLDTVGLGGVGFTPLVRIGDKVSAGQPLLRVVLDEVVDGARSLVTPVLVTEPSGHAIEWVAAFGPVEVGQPMALLVPDGLAAPANGDAAAFEERLSRDVRVPLAHGLHARPCARLAETLKGFDAQVRVAAAGREASLASPTAMLRLAVRHGDTITLLASGPDADAALAELARTIEGGMGEGAPFPVGSATTAEAHVADADAAVVQVTAPLAGDVLRGVTASPGIAVGPVWRPVQPEPPIDAIGAGAEVEAARLHDALAAVRAKLGSANGGQAEEDAILGAHLALLDDPELSGGALALIAEGMSAGLAWRRILHAEAAALRATGDARFAERAADFLDLDLRVQWQLVGTEPPIVVAPAGSILVADDLLPSQVAALPPGGVAGLATARGGPTSHVAIIAASRGLPALVALGNAVLGIADGTTVVLDAAGGALEVDPGADRVNAARAEAALREARRAAALAASSRPGATADGHRVKVFANFGKLDDVAPALAQGAEGCGLLRTEFLFLDRADAPDEDEQAACYGAIAKALEGRPLIVRLLDIGGDKPAPYLPIAVEENPALGLRGIRVGLARPEVLSTQIRAILRATSSGDIRIMAPMIARVEELRDVREVLLAEAAALGVAAPELGVMVETPAAAVMADRLAAECDFLSIGTNDLTQYTLAMDRGNAAVAGGIDGLDPAVLRLIAQTCAGADRFGKWVGVCGGLASDPLAVGLLVGLGVAELSAAPGQVAEVKATLAALTREHCEIVASEALEASSAAQVRALAANLLRKAGL
ncbi:phosphoenolpyruvate--protein phosphotransferase [Novosphingobium guangzhouense]|uniref:phosphoenolpyruvate--protein phosphotransferase n=1 Tax=Novosphingobium guangzhouense TaxID=1850347 RepID=A0A2K2G6H8_9SPHN|nr:phosphoenolpyruvate--protein phosphotransferase [Novosphingobium guangzhouense]PNU06645.1 phosphoenolpyruvate--protein phosphotransferase [Novosphingobium guangzhouense]